MQNAGWKETFEGAREALSRWWHIVWTSLIGLVIGVVPGAGAAIASFVAYQQSRTFSKTPELYGTGHIEGADRTGIVKQRRHRRNFGSVAWSSESPAALRRRSCWSSCSSMASRSAPICSWNRPRSPMVRSLRWR